MNEIMLINPAKKKAKKKYKKRATQKTRYRRRRNPTTGMPDVMSVVAIAGGGVAGMVVPKLVVPTAAPMVRYGVQAGMALATIMFGGKIVGKKISDPLGGGMLAALGITLFNDFVLKPKGQTVLDQSMLPIAPDLRELPSGTLYTEDESDIIMAPAVSDLSELDEEMYEEEEDEDDDYA